MVHWFAASMGVWSMQPYAKVECVPGGEVRLPSAVVIVGAAGFHSALNGEYIRVAKKSADHCASFTKRDGSKHLIFNLRQGVWQIVRKRSGSGIFATCPGTGRCNPVKLQNTWIAGAAGEPIPKMRIDSLQLPQLLQVFGDSKLRGLYRYTSPSFDGEGSPEYQHVQKEIILGYTDSRWTFSEAALLGSEFSLDAPHAANTEPEALRVNSEQVLSPSAQNIEIVGPDEKFALASCSSEMLRPDALPKRCFGSLIIVAAVGDAGLPVALEVTGGPSAAAALRGTLRRVEDFEGRAAFARSDKGVFLFYSDQLGGWQISRSLGRGGGAYHPDASGTNPMMLQGDWQVQDADHGDMRSSSSLQLEIVKPQRHLTLHGWPSQLEEELLGGTYILEPTFRNGRPMYSRYHSSLNMSVFFFFSQLDAAWHLEDTIGRVFARSFSPNVYHPDEVRGWHTTGEGLGRLTTSCAISSVQASTVVLGPAKVIVVGREGRLNSAINGEYVRTAIDRTRRPSYSKSDNSMHLYFNERYNDWFISKYKESDEAGALAFCPDARAQDPTKLSLPWKVGNKIDPAVYIRQVELASAFYLRSEGVVDAVFQQSGEAHGRSTYSSVTQDGMPQLLLHFEPKSGISGGSWVLSRFGTQGFLARAAGHAPVTYSPDSASGRWEVMAATGKGISRAVSIQIRTVVNGVSALHIVDPFVNSSNSSRNISTMSERWRSIGGLHRRVADHDGRPSYRREGIDGSLRFVFSNRHGDWRIYLESRGIGYALAYCCDVLAQRPEQIRSPWQIFNGVSFETAHIEILGVETRKSNWDIGLDSTVSHLLLCGFLVLLVVCCLHGSAPVPTDDGEQKPIAALTPGGSESRQRKRRSHRHVDSRGEPCTVACAEKS